MTVVRVKGFKIFKSRHGKEYCYHRETGERIDLEKYPVGSAGFLAECARITAMVAAATPKPGTLGLLIEAYRGHAAFLDLAPRTRSDYQIVFDYLKPIADTPLVKFDKPLIVRIRDKATTKGRAADRPTTSKPSCHCSSLGAASADSSPPIPRRASRASGARRDCLTQIGRGQTKSATPH